jgi:hypothetical protein
VRKKEDKEKKTNFMDNLEMPKEKIVTLLHLEIRKSGA